MKPRKVSVESARTRTFTVAEWDNVYKQAPAHIKPMLIVAGATGLRQANITHMRWENVSLERKMLWVEARKAKQKVAIGVPLNPDAAAVLKAQKAAQCAKPSEWVFPYRGKPIDQINYSWLLTLEKAGLGHFERWKDAKGKEHRKWHGVGLVWHSIRHSWASWARAAGVELDRVRQMGGWTDYRSVQRYSHFSVDALRADAARVKPIDLGSSLSETDSDVPNSVPNHDGSDGSDAALTAL